jgi:D-tagatose-1,6-bisphosphate aldolase subunit GatZ/KbaZ
MSDKYGLSRDKLVIGADHLGPHLWKTEPSTTALQRTDELVRACVSAGFHKIHLDTAICCSDDTGPQLDPELAGERAARLCKTAEAAAENRPATEKPVYVIGDEVPLPGGDLDESGKLNVTDPDRLTSVLDLYHHHFYKAGLEPVWRRVIAIVVQPGIEYGDHQVAVYQRSRAVSLSAYHTQLPPYMTYEVHSADYQPAQALGQLIRDHFVIVKIGPCLTYALRKALFALADIESGWSVIQTKSHLRRIMDNIMRQQPGFWRSHYQGSLDELRDMREHSFRDRIRYYWNVPEAVHAVNTLLKNLDRPLPVELVESYMGELGMDASADLADERLFSNARQILQYSMRKILKPYFDAC